MGRACPPGCAAAWTCRSRRGQAAPQSPRRRSKEPPRPTRAVDGPRVAACPLPRRFCSPAGQAPQVPVARACHGWLRSTVYSSGLPSGVQLRSDVRRAYAAAPRGDRGEHRCICGARLRRLSSAAPTPASAVRWVLSGLPAAFSPANNVDLDAALSTPGSTVAAVNCAALGLQRGERTLSK